MYMLSQTLIHTNCNLNYEFMYMIIWSFIINVTNVHINGKWGTEPTPFGGYKQSGNGREGGVFGFEDFLEIKAVMGYYP